MKKETRFNHRQNRYELIFNHSRDIILILQSDGRIVDANRSAVDAYGFSYEELVNKTIFDLRQPDADSLVKEQMQEASKEHLLFEATHRRKDGSSFPVEVSSQAFRFDSDNFLLSIIRDISDRIGVEKKLRLAQKQLNSMIEFLPDATFAIDKERKVIAWNRAMETMTGVKKEDMIGKGDFAYSLPFYNEARPMLIDFIFSDTFDQFDCTYDLKRTNDSLYTQSFVENFFPGQDIYLWAKATPLYDENHQVIGAIESIRDITERKRVEDAIKDSRDFYLSIFNELPTLAWHADRRGRYIDLNKSWLDFTGRTLQEEQNYGWMENIHPDDVGNVSIAYRHALKDRRPFKLEYRLRRYDRKYRWIIHSGRPYSGIKGEFAGYIGVCYDITELKSTKEQVLKLSTAVEQGPSIVIITNTAGEIEYVNPKFTEITGYHYDEVIGKNPRILKSGKVPLEEYKKLWKVISAGQEWRGEFLNKKKSGELYWEYASISSIRDSTDKITHYLAVKEDITERKKTGEKISFLAFNDTLTGLPNRTKFTEILANRLEATGSSINTISVLFIDLDMFKRVNDTLGHGAGDKLLVDVGKRLTAIVDNQGIVSRMGGDEFTVLLELPHNEALKEIVEKILHGFRKPWIIDDLEFYFTASIGVATYPGDGEDAETLLKRADTAMYWAKERGKNNYQFYTSTIQDRSLRKVRLENHLHHALEQQELILYYQPQVHIESKEIIAVETLLRWIHPTMGLISPEEFIPLAEEAGLIIPIEKWVLKTACTQAGIWLKKNKTLKIAVNLSARHFQQSSLIETITRTFEETKIDPTQLELEITESTAMKDPELTIKILNSLKSMGVSISVDDFGTGYSSLNYLKRFPLKKLKIDRSFISDITSDQEDEAIVSTIIVLAKSLHLEVVGEGVETKEQIAFLKRLGCSIVQGYYYSKPLPGTEIEKILSKGFLTE